MPEKEKNAPPNANNIYRNIQFGHLKGVQDMFILRITNNDNTHNDTAYYSFEEALAVCRKTDITGIKNVCVMNGGASEVLYIVFKDGENTNSLCNGDIVKLKNKWASKGEEKYRFVVSNIHEEFERCKITCLNSKMFFAPSENVDIKMVEVVGKRYDT